MDMPKLIKERSKKAGLPPGTLIHIGEKKTGEAKIKIIDYDEAHLQEKEIRKLDECIPYKDKPTVTWIDVEGIHQVEILEKLGDCFGLHPLVMEDILNTDQRPKTEDYTDYIYTVLKMIRYDDKDGMIVTEQVSIILGQNFVISFQEGTDGDVFNSVRVRVRSEKSHIRRMGADYLAYSLLDSIVDNYFAVFEKLGEKIEFLEDELVSSPTPKTLQIIHDLKREMIFLRKSVWPLREVINAFERGDSPLIKSATRIYLKDVYDHTIQVIDNVETFRDMLSGMLDIYLSSISNRLNSVMKVLTIIATIFMPLTFLAGVYGMNFKYMPELEWHWGYPLILLIMITIALTMLVYFKIKKWM
jgi:magnesium transporter